MSSDTGLNPSLHGRVVFLSASVPSQKRSQEFLHKREAGARIQEAVISVVRAILDHDGRLVFGGHPSISPLVATVAHEYENRHPARGINSPQPVIIYQSRAYEAAEQPESTEYLSRLGVAQTVWVPAECGEKYNPAITHAPQCGNSLGLMRSRMIQETQPVAMICIGGMEGVEEEAQCFHRYFPQSPVFAFASTGGVTSKMCDPGGSMLSWVFNVEDGIVGDGYDQSHAGRAIFPGMGIPYDFLARRLVERIAAWGGSDFNETR